MKIVLLSRFHEVHGSYCIRQDDFRCLYTQREGENYTIKGGTESYITLTGMLTELKEYNATLHT